MVFDYSWLIGGPQGSGVDTAANIFSRVGAKLGYHVFGKREYHSNIKGLHSYFVVRLSRDNKVRSNVNGANFMVAFDAETMIRHGLEILKDGLFLLFQTYLLFWNRSVPPGVLRDLIYPD